MARYARALTAVVRTENLKFFYLAYALPVVLFLVKTTPPFQVPDEDQHFFRAEEISEGELIPIKVGRYSTGGRIDTNLPLVSQMVNNPPAVLHLTGPMTRDLLTQMSNPSWSGQRAYHQFQQQASYPPPFYFIQAACISFGRWCQLRIVQTLYLTRFINGLCMIALGALALHLAARGRALFFVLLLLPTTLNQFASASQDAEVIASGILYAALLTRWAVGKAPSLWVFLVTLALLSTIIASRPPYCSLALLLLLPQILLPERWPRRGSVGGGPSAERWCCGSMRNCLVRHSRSDV